MSDRSRLEPASITNRWGHEAVIALTKNEYQPIKIRMQGIQTLNVYQRFVQSEQVFFVDYFQPNSRSTGRRWVRWFVMHFDQETLQELGKIA